MTPSSDSDPAVAEDHQQRLLKVPVSRSVSGTLTGQSDNGSVGVLFDGLESSADLAWLNVITRCANARPVEAHENVVPVESVNPPRAPHAKGDCLNFEGSIGRNAADHVLGSALERPERHAALAISVEGRREATRITDSPHLLVQDDLLVEAARLGRADTHMHSLNHCPQVGQTKIS